MKNRIINVDRIFEGEDAGQKSQEEIKSQIIDQHEDVQFKQSDNGESVTIELPSGYRYEIPNKTLAFYQQIFDDNMEKYVVYEKYIPVIDRLLTIKDNESQIRVKIEKLKDIHNNFSMIEEEQGINSIQYRIINTDELDEISSKKIFNAYASGDLTQLDPDELNILNNYINDYLLYYKYLIGVFKIYD